MDHVVESHGPDALLASMLKDQGSSSLGTSLPSGAGPDALLASLIKDQASSSTLDHCNHCHEDGDTDDEYDDDEYEDFGEDISMEEMAALITAHPELSMDLSMPMEGSFKEKFRRVKKAGAAAFRSYRKTRKADKIAKAAKLKPNVVPVEPKSTTSSPTDPGLGKPAAVTPASPLANVTPQTGSTLVKSTPPTPAKPALSAAAAKPTTPAPSIAKPTTSVPVKDPVSKSSSSSVPSRSLSVGSQQLVNALKTLIHQDIDTSLKDLSTAILSSTNNPNAYYANIALASALGTLRLPVEAQMKNGMDIGDMVAQSRSTSVKRTPLDSGTLANMKHIMSIFALEVNRASSGPATNAKEKAIAHGAAVGQELVSTLSKTYMLHEHSVLNESHPVVRLGAILTSLLGITQAQISFQPEINEFVHAAVKPIWSHPLTQGTFNEVIINLFE